jgi:predicted DCC family thiol-disulfide oxidoreductase YuxK
MTPEITFLHDGDCPLCAREVALLQRLDKGRGRLAFDDIATPGFDASHHGRTHAELMARIHGVLPDGTVIEGVEVFAAPMRRWDSAGSSRALIMRACCPSPC